jgi:signal transduction histidine kinase
MKRLECEWQVSPWYALWSALLWLFLLQAVQAQSAPASLMHCAPLQASHAQVQDRVVDASQIGPEALSLTEYLSVLEDVSGKLTLDEVQKTPLAARFQGGLPAAYGINHGLTQSAFWLRLTLCNNSAQPLQRMLELRFALLSKIQFHQPLASGGWQSVSTGNVMPFASRVYPNRFFVFPVHLAAHQKQVLYLRIESLNSMNIIPFLSTPQQFHRWERNDYLIQAWYFGMALAMILFNLVLLIALRELIYGLYLNFAFCAAITVAVYNGFANEYVWPNWPHMADISIFAAASLSTATMLRFMRAMLSTGSTSPRIDGWLKWLGRLALVSLIGLVIWPQVVMMMVVALYLLALFAMFGVCLYYLREKQRSAALFLLAFSTLMVGAVLSVFTGLGWMSINGFNSNIMQIGSGMEMLLLAFALADRINRLAQEKATAQQQALLAQQLLLENLHSSEQVLEQRVAERTRELSQSNAALASTNGELDAMVQRIEASRQQAHEAQAQATAAQAALLMAKDQMIQADKMASLGQLMSSVGEEINLALSGIQVSGKKMARALYHALSGIAPMLRQLDGGMIPHFLRLIQIANTSANTTANTTANTPDTTRNDGEQAQLLEQLKQQLQQAGVPTTHTWANPANPANTEERIDTAQILLHLQAHTEPQTYVPLLRHPAAGAILKLVQSIAIVKENSAHIKSAVQEVGKIVRALKSFSHVGGNEVAIKRHLVDEIETVLVIYQKLIEGQNRLVRQFDEIDPLYYQPEKLKQVWIGLIQNALQAMQQPGTLTIGIRRVGNEAVVSIGDTGCGIAADMLPNIFEPLLTMRQSGAGIGLDIVKHVIDQHHGRIEIQSQPGLGTTVSVFLPYET